MNARAIVGLFEPPPTREQRLEQAQRFAEQILKAICSRPTLCTGAVLCGGRRIVCAVADTEHFREISGMRHSLIIGMYTKASDPARIVRDIEETLAEYFEGCVIPTIIRA